MSLRSLWHLLRSWKNYRTGSAPSQDEPYHRSGDELEPALEETETRQSQNQAIFAKDSRVSESLPIWAARPPQEELDLPEQIEKAVGQILCSIGIRARVLDRDHLLKMALRLNEVAALEKDQGNYPLAEALCQRALDIFQKIEDPDHPQLVAILENYAAILHCLSRSHEAGLAEDRAAAIRVHWLEEESWHSIPRKPDSRIQK